MDLRLIFFLEKTKASMKQFTRQGQSAHLANVHVRKEPAFSFLQLKGQLGWF
jgi:hypothetical protein